MKREKYEEWELKNYENEIKKLQTSKDIIKNSDYGNFSTTICCYYAIKFQEFHNTVRAINSYEKKKRSEYYMLKLKELKKDTDENVDNFNNKSYERKIDNEDSCQMSIDNVWSM
jgi:hypothetical protein